MERSFLEGLGLEDAVIGQILEEHGRESAQRDYADAVKNAVMGLRFSSKAAEREFMAQFNAQQWEIKDGVPVGLEEFIQEWKVNDPYAFAADRPVPQFVAPAGLGGSGSLPAAPANVARAKAMGAERAAALKSSSEIMKYFL